MEEFLLKVLTTNFIKGRGSVGLGIVITIVMVYL